MAEEMGPLVPDFVEEVIRAPRLFRTAYGPHKRVVSETPGEDMAKQSFKDECDINVIMKQYSRTGMLEMVARREPVYADVTGADFREAMELVAGAKSLFAELPAAVRERFKNDPALYLEFMENPDEKAVAEMVKLGMLKPEAVERRDREAAAAAAAAKADAELLGRAKAEEAAKAASRAVVAPPKGDV